MKHEEILAVALVLAFPGAPAFAQTSLITDEDALFGGDEVVQSAPAATEGSATAALTKSETVLIGGSFTGSVSAENAWSDPWNDGFDPSDADDSAMTTTLSGLVFFDARPDGDFRVYGSVKTEWPFEETTSEDSSVPNTQVFEFFSDWSWNDGVFFRFGKSTVKWGVGYFWSPADVINLKAIDIMDPTAQREGPVSFKANFPVPGTQNNLYAYAICDEATMNAADTAVAAKAEFLLGNYEFGFGGFYKRHHPERGMLTVTGPLLNLDLFGEASLSRGSDKQFVTKVTDATLAGIETKIYSDRFFLSATAGASYMNDDLKLTVLAQYFYNGEGYDDADREARIDEALAYDNGGSSFNDFLKFLIANSGKHYAAFSFTRTELFTVDLSASVFVMANLSDLSAYVKPSLTWTPLDHMSFTVDAAFAFGMENSEYLVIHGGPAVILGVSATLGTGSF
ncbi:MAG: hypothetical protein NT080_04575 [Spirochaetes bacterium]|nr:hypothetical protein [Spirochaetota bacterium]